MQGLTFMKTEYRRCVISVRCFFLVVFFLRFFIIMASDLSWGNARNARQLIVLVRCLWKHISLSDQYSSVLKSPPHSVYPLLWAPLESPSSCLPQDTPVCFTSFPGHADFVPVRLPSRAALDSIRLMRDTHYVDHTQSG